MRAGRTEPNEQIQSSQHSRGFKNEIKEKKSVALENTFSVSPMCIFPLVVNVGSSQETLNPGALLGHLGHHSEFQKGE